VYLRSKSRPVKRVQVSFTGDQWGLIEHLKQTMGGSDADVVRNIVLAWLAEKSIISSDIKNKIEGKK
jgi:hypothetical protein